MIVCLCVIKVYKTLQIKMAKEIIKTSFINFLAFDFIIFTTAKTPKTAKNKSIQLLFVKPIGKMVMSGKIKQ